MARREVIEPTTADDVVAFQTRWSLNLAELAYLLGVSDYTLSRWLRQQAPIFNPRLLTLALEGLAVRLARQEEERAWREKEMRELLVTRQAE